MDATKLNKIYDLLVLFGGASETYRQSFVYEHLDSEYPCREWRFCGHLGFGGKYWSETNTVSFYSEDETALHKEIVVKLNTELSKI